MKRSAAALLLVLVASPALAASVVATPALDPPFGGGVSCVISNTSDSKPITVEWGLYDYLGNAVWGPTTATLQPLRNTRTGPAVTVQSACIVKVVSGSKKSLRVALVAQDSGDDIVAAVNGQ